VTHRISCSRRDAHFRVAFSPQLDQPADGFKIGMTIAARYHQPPKVSDRFQRRDGDSRFEVGIPTTEAEAREIDRKSKI
jgi:hypothetical protein